LVEVFSDKKANLGVTLFWLVIPILVMMMLASPERGLQVVYIPLSSIPVVLSFAVEHFWF
jgi:hypothetical protein